MSGKRAFSIRPDKSIRRGAAVIIAVVREAMEYENSHVLNELNGKEDVNISAALEWIYQYIDEDIEEMI